MIYVALFTSLELMLERLYWANRNDDNDKGINKKHIMLLTTTP